MKTNLKSLMTILAVLTLACGSAHAVLITNGASTVASDGFEGYFAGYNPPPSPWVSALPPGTNWGGLVGPVASPPHAYAST